ncbi:bifunctional phosphoribosylaminoimidazolecarboxamide formyltransferase/IMP cyclohydrolase [Filifactor villosus]|uniref:Bifunctional purine biosynthesis protein PurH n=1 Tax=Filifactor villosus TaxID=29374 RepID=A0ABV9QLG0_9FIRM
MKRALLSVTDKTGIVEMAKALEELGYEVVSTGGTLKTIREAGVSAKAIEEITQFPEMLDGRVKTLHPVVHGGLLFRRDVESHVNTAKEHDIEPIDVVVVNLYRFEETLKAEKPHEEIIENIDIGGPSMVRSAAKNHRDVLIVTDVKDYERVIEKLKEGSADLAFREEMAMKAFAQTAYYDSMIARYFSQYTGKQSETFTLGLKKEGTLRYGENPHQSAAVYRDGFEDSLLSDYEQLNGKELSFNNLNDLNVAVELARCLKEEGRVATVALKHATPCAVALGDSVFESYSKAYDADPVSIFGGIVSCTGTVDLETAKMMNKIFLEIVAAPDFTQEALEELRTKKNLRVLKVDLQKELAEIDLKYISGKVLLQDTDKDADEGFEVVTEVWPSESRKRDMLFGMKVVQYVKSNAVVLVKDGVTLAIGGGQTSRIWALNSARNNNPDKDFSGAVLCSDAFFPFYDCVEAAHEMGVEAIIQPGGSVRDRESIDKCDEYKMSMVFTGVRHFKH